MDKILHVYSNDVTEWIIAYSPEDAIKVWEEDVGYEYELDNGIFVLESDDKELSIHNVDEGGSETYTMREWAEKMGRSYLCSTEY
jgi:hypothetical protein